MAAVESPEVVRVVFMEDDVRGMVEEHNADEDNDPVDVDQALERAHEWGRHIADTACSLVSEQLESVITVGQP